MFFIAIVVCSSLSILGYFQFDWVMRLAKVNFKHFSLKAQRIVLTCLGSVAIIPIIILRAVSPTIEDTYYLYAVIANLAVLTIYIFTVRGISQLAIKREKVKEKIIELKLQNSNDYDLIKKELKSQYDISASVKEIENAIRKIQEKSKENE